MRGRPDLRYMDLQHEISLGGEHGLWARAYVSGIEEGFSTSNVESHFKKEQPLYCPPNDMVMTSDQLIFSLDLFMQKHKSIPVGQMESSSNEQQLMQDHFANSHSGYERINTLLLAMLKELYPCK